MKEIWERGRRERGGRRSLRKRLLETNENEREIQRVVMSSGQERRERFR